MVISLVHILDYGSYPIPERLRLKDFKILAMRQNFLLKVVGGFQIVFKDGIIGCSGCLSLGMVEYDCFVQKYKKG